MANGSDGLAVAMEEYGLLLTEMGPTSDLLIPIKASSRIKYTCTTLSKKFIVMGANTGGLYLFDRLSLRYLRLMGNKDGSIQKMRFSKNHHILGVTTSIGIILVWYVGSRTRGKPKFIKKSEEHKGASVLSLCWDDTGARLFAGDDRGVVTVTNVPTINLPSQSNESSSSAKKFKIRHPNVVIAKAQSSIIQLDCAGNKLLISTMTKCVILDLDSLECTPVGTKPREGLFGACFVKEKNSETLTIYTARPGSRLWEASTDGQVLSTQQYKKLLAIPPAPILGFGHSGTILPVSKEISPQSVNFAKLLLIRDRYLVTWHGSAVYILDAVMGQVVSWHQMETDVADICCHGNELYVYHCDGVLSWYSLLSVKECVARLFEMRETKQCAKVVLECQHYIIPGAARDLVPVAMVTKLRGHFDDDEECKDLVARLEELEENLEPETVASVLPPGIRDGEADSPDTMSVCSDAFQCDGPYTFTADSGVEDDDNLSVTHGEDGPEKTHKNPLKKISLDMSFEKMLISAAAKAKKFAQEKQIGRGRQPATDKQTTLKEGTDGEVPSSDLSNSGFNALRLSDDSSEAGAVGCDVQATSAWQDEAGGVLLVKKATSTAGSHSDESEARLSDSETPSVPGDERKDKPGAKDKKKKKRRVTTVDIDNPLKRNEGVALMSPEGLGSNYSHRGTYSSFGNTEVNAKKLFKERALSDSGLSTKQARVMNEAPTELTPAIPAMFSKARGLLKKLKSAEDGPGVQECLPESETLSEDGGELENEPTVLPCPQNVQLLTTVSAEVRKETKNPTVLCNTRVLLQILTDWVQQLHVAADSCEELEKLQEANKAEKQAHINLKTFLEQDDLENVSFLAGMCFDLGIYGPRTSKKALSRDNNCECVHSRNLHEHKDVERDALNQEDHDVAGGVESDSSHLSQTPVITSPSQSMNIEIDCIINHSNPERCTTSRNIKEDFVADHTDISVPSLTSAVSASCTHHPPHGQELKTTNVRGPDGIAINGPTSEVCPSESHKPADVLVKDNLSERNEKPGSGPDILSSCSECSRCCKGKVNSSPQNFETTWKCPLCIRTCDKEFVFITQNEGDGSIAERRNDTRDERRAVFVFRFFDLLSVKRVRRTMKMSPGCREKTWRALLQCLQSVAVQDSVHQYICEGHVTRALHELHDKSSEFQGALLHHLTSLYKQDGRQTVLACARMFPDVQPCEVSQMCRQVMSRDVQSGASDFVLYMKELMRWRAETGETRERIVADICRDTDVMTSWFHNTLLADESGDRHCAHCGQPRPGSHRFPWQHEDQLRLILNLLCQRPSDVGLVHFMNLCWKHGYWSGLLRLMVHVGLREDAVSLVVQLGDVTLLSKTRPWGLLPKSLKEWRHLLELVASRSCLPGVSSHHVCAPCGSNWTPDVSWETVTRLALEQLGAGHTVDILRSLSCPTPPLDSHFYYKCVAGAVIEKKQRAVCHELVKRLDSYLWSQRTNALSPKLNVYREQEQSSSIKVKDDSKPQLEPYAHVTTLEDAASPWGVNLRLVDSECVVCTLPLCEQISSSNQGLLVFECGHVFHKQCVQESACVVCFYRGLTTVGRTSSTSR